ncbi:conserved hypothetical protein [Catenulispora acidiphila DSM 44928]|uniref:Uncharacterized protein n=1 Tax=Catenulispora acidiphila (strain DSM 44928 / JCM 14897 / NBRC 102108 / NRRL B-24433 / ID139908) TaxID=479433 RepID=C7QD56_CATAD|nr:rhomboid-like protein [Catenulispora acidiphila]ACU70766.1 conserved hypothetical protein [Catenulispora acidiphila DSM 44928]
MLSRLPADVWDYVRDAPGTYLWLVALFGVSRYVRRLPAERATKLLEANSTNLARLRQAPLKVMVTSLFFTTGTSWLFYAVTYSVFHAPAEHWLGTWRWLVVLGLAHVGATLLSEGWVAREIRAGRLPRSERMAADYGVSYAQAGAAAVLTYRIPEPWRLLYLAALIAFYGYGWVKNRRDFTAIGHVCAVAIGLACFWIAP